MEPNPKDCHTLTEFGALDSKEDKSGGLLSWVSSKWKRVKGSKVPGRAANKEDVGEKKTNGSSVQGGQGSGSEGQRVIIPPIDLPLPEGGSSCIQNADDNASIGSSVSDGSVMNRSGQFIMPKRTLTGVLNRLSSILAMNTQSQIYKDMEFKQYWMPDKDCKECYECGDKFTTFRRRHHCRVCGQVFCSRCCNQEVPGRVMGYTGDLRVCSYCCNVVLSYAQQNPSGEISEPLQEDLKTLAKEGKESSLKVVLHGFGRWTPIPRRKEINGDEDSNWNRSASATDLDSYGQKFSSNMFDLTPQTELASQQLIAEDERRLLIEDSVQLKNIWQLIKHPTEGIEFQSHRYRLRTYPNCILGNSLVDYLIKADKAGNRMQAVVIGQALVDARWLECVTLNQQIFRDEYVLYRPGEAAARESPDEDLSKDTAAQEVNLEPSWLSEIQQQDSDSLSLSEEQDIKPSTHPPSVFYVSKDGKGGDESPKRKKLQKPDKGGKIMDSESFAETDMENTGAFEEFIRGALIVSASNTKMDSIESLQRSWHSDDTIDSSDNSTASLAYQRMIKAHKEHMTNLTKQLLTQEGLSMGWTDLIMTKATKVAEVVNPDVRHEGDEMDIRAYVQVKKIPGGEKTDTKIYHGVVCSKNISHKKMQHSINNAKILLLRCSIEYQRREQKFSSLEPQILQENEFIKNNVSKIAAWKPDLLLVEKSVSRLAQQFILDEGITLVLNVKPSVMKRVARLTQADIVSSIDGLVNKPTLGTCRNFRVHTHSLPKGYKKTLMYFDGCPAHLGCTVTLRGASEPELKRVKNILQFIIYIAFNSRLEISFLMDEFAMPPPAPDEVPLGIDALGSSPESPDKKFEFKEQGKENEKNLEFKPLSSITVSEEIGEVHAGKPLSAFPHPDLDPQMGKLTDMLQKEIVEGDIPVLQLTKPKPDVRSQGGSGHRDANPAKRSASKSPVRQTKNSKSPKHGDSAHGHNTLDVQNSSDSGKIYSSSGSENSEDKRGSTSASVVLDKSDPLQTYQQTEDDSIFFTTEQMKAETIKQSQIFKKTLDDIILSGSPYLRYEVPFLVTEEGQNCASRKYLQKDLYWSVHLTPDGHKKQRQRFGDLETHFEDVFGMNGVEVAPPHQFLLETVVKPVTDREMQGLLADFRATGGRIKPICPQESKLQKMHRNDHIAQSTEHKNSEVVGDLIWEKKTDCLNPALHQRIAVSFCSFSYVSSNTPNHCVFPWVVKMAFYGRNDITLGGFLERYCFREAYKCPHENCGTPMVDHIRRFVHGQGCIQITMRKLEHKLPGFTDTILTWSYCNKCKQASAVVPIALETWSLSFAKYLELRFHGNVYTRRDAQKSCTHSLHSDHYQYFGFKQTVASFKYSTVKNKDIALPPLRICYVKDCGFWEEQTLKWMPAVNWHYKTKEGLKKLYQDGLQVFDSIVQLLHKLRLETQSDKQAEVVEKHLGQQQKDKADFREKMEKLFKHFPVNQDMVSADSMISDAAILEVTDGMVRMKQLVAENVSDWNTKILEFQHQQKKMEKEKNKKDSMQKSGKESNSGTPKTGNSSPSNASGVEKVSLPTAEKTTVEEGSYDPLAAWCCNNVSKEMEEAMKDISKTPETPREVIVGKPYGEERAPEATISAVSEHKGHRKTKSADESKNTREGAERGSKQGGAMKNIITSFLSSIGPVPIHNPFPPDEHYLLPLSDDIPVIVLDREPSSIIAYALSSIEYKVKLNELKQLALSKEAYDINQIKKGGLSRVESTGRLDAVQHWKAAGGVLKFLRSAKGQSSRDSSPSRKKDLEASVKFTPGESESSYEASTYFEEIDGKEAKTPKYHIELQYAEGSSKFYCQVYHAESFKQMRKILCPEGEAGYIRSLSRCINWLAKGGKSGSAFCKTQDDRYILKQMSKPEVQSFLEFAPHYIEYTLKSHTDKSPTALAKIVGAYRIGFRNNQTNMATKQDLLVMENLFYPQSKKITQVYDLKGSERNRLVKTANQKSEDLVLLDENLLKMSLDNPLYLRPHARKVLMSAITNDTQFLSSHLVMDYSLLMGVDEQKGEVLVGIIDYIRTFTWDKKLETMVKSSGILGGQGKMPTVVSPELYRTRFLEAMDRYFLEAPDRWNGLSCDLEI